MAFDFDLGFGAAVDFKAAGRPRWRDDVLRGDSVTSSASTLPSSLSSSLLVFSCAVVACTGDSVVLALFLGFVLCGTMIAAVRLGRFIGDDTEVAERLATSAFCFCERTLEEGTVLGGKISSLSSTGLSLQCNVRLSLDNSDDDAAMAEVSCS